MNSGISLVTDRESPTVVGGPSAAALHTRSTFRPDIEGLRGIAVLSLLAIHCFPSWARGGLIGVDMFFVLSGYLITDQVLRAQRAGTFSGRGYGARRAIRLLPPLCVVLAACLLFAVLFTSPQDAREIGRQVGLSTLFVSNVVAWKAAVPLDPLGSGQPLHHLWSLATVAQFYLVWPIVLAWTARRPHLALPLIGGLLLASFMVNVNFVADAPAAVYFLPAGRGWELMIGALLAHLSQPGRAGFPAQSSRPADAAGVSRPDTNPLLSWLGPVLLGIALLLVEHTAHFPGWWALLPTLGTAALLAAGPQGWINRHVLSLPVLRFYGAISYPLYLWHWPLLCFPAVLDLPLTNDVRVIILLAAVVLAALTHELVEKPLLAEPRRTRLALKLAATLALVGTLGWIVMHTDGLAQTYPSGLQSMG